MPRVMSYHNQCKNANTVVLQEPLVFKNTHDYSTYIENLEVQLTRANAHIKLLEDQQKNKNSSMLYSKSNQFNQRIYDERNVAPQSSSHLDRYDLNMLGVASSRADDNSSEIEIQNLMESLSRCEEEKNYYAAKMKEIHALYEQSERHRSLMVGFIDDMERKSNHIQNYIASLERKLAMTVEERDIYRMKSLSVSPLAADQREKVPIKRPRAGGQRSMKE